MTSPPTILLRLTATQHERLRGHLFCPDGKESVAIALCGTRKSADRLVLSVHQIKLVPSSDCSMRSPTRVVWSVEPYVPWFAEAARKRMVILKLHSHPTGSRSFSALDDAADRALLRGLQRLASNDLGHASAIMLPDGELRARLLGTDGKMRFINRVTVVGDEVVDFDRPALGRRRLRDEATLRTAQMFGHGTVSKLSRMRVGVIGCSGTGSWVIEMLARLGVGELILVDPDRVERKNLNRIINSTAKDAAKRQLKVRIFCRAIGRVGLGTKVVPYPAQIMQRKVVEMLASCDFLFGCVDSADGRDAINRIAAFYNIPFIDVGVHLEADGRGGVQQVCAAVHYLIPDGSSLLSRHVISSEGVRAESLHRRAPKQYKALRKEGYIAGIKVDSPAVISINGFAATHGVNEMLARIHPFRRDPNREFRHQTFSLADGAWLRIDDGPPCPLLAKRAGRGDCTPLLDNAELS